MPNVSGSRTALVVPTIRLMMCRTSRPLVMMAQMLVMTVVVVVRGVCHGLVVMVVRVRQCRILLFFRGLYEVHEKRAG